MTATASQLKAIDDLMERASHALEAAEYFETERLCMKAIESAMRTSDFERLARICLPLQEARRQRRHLAADTGEVFLIRGRLPKPADIKPGCYLIEPPLLGIDGRTLRENANARGIPVIVVTHEPTTRKGTWPIVAVGTGPRMQTSVRVYVEPPSVPPPPQWFLATNEALGDAAISKAIASPAAWRAEDLQHYLDAHPDHEKLLQAFADACRQAANEPPPLRPFRRGMDDPYSF